MTACLFTWLVSDYAASFEDAVERMNSGDLLIVNRQMAAIIVRHEQHGVLVWTANGLAYIEEYLTTAMPANSIATLRSLSFDTTDAAMNITRKLDKFMSEFTPTVSPAALQMMCNAGGTASLPRSTHYSDDDHALMCMASPAYLVVHTYIRVGLAVSMKSQNLYDIEDLLQYGDLDDSLIDGVRLGSDIHFLTPSAAPPTR